MRSLHEFIINFRRFRMAGILNVIGLSVAFAAFTVIVVQLIFQEGYDRFRPDADRIFRVEILFPTAMEYSAIGPMAVAGYLKDRVPLIEDYFLLSSGESDVFRIKRENGQEDRYKEENIGVTFPFVSVAGLEVVEGDGSQALSEPDKLLIPETTARKWFGSGPVVGREVEQGEKTYVVGAVYQDMPANSVFKNCCYTGLKEKTDWKDWGMQTYVKATTE